MGWAPTAEQLLNLDGVRRRADRFRFELWRDGYYLGDLAPDSARPPTVSVDTSRATVRTLTNFHLPAGQANEVHTVRDRVRAVMVLQDGTEYRLGQFMWGDDNQPRRPWGTERSSTLVDESFQFDQPLRAAYGWGPGVGVVLAALNLTGPFLRAGTVSWDDSSIAFGAPRSYDPSANRLRVINELMALIGYLPAHFDRNGQLWLREPPDMTVTPELRYDPGPRIHADSVVESNDLLDAPNEFIVYEASGDGPPIYGHYDIPNAAPHSIANRGGVIVPHVESQQGLDTQAQAYKAAKALASTASNVAYRWVTWDSPADPRHDVWDPVSVLGETWLETSWSIECRSGGPMRHEAKMVYV